jgi:hypothetical protein
MTSTNDTEQRFTLDEAKAQAWLERTVSVYDGTAEDDSGADELPQISSTWNPMEPDEETEVWRLVRRAVDAGIIGRVGDGLDLDFEYVDDGDGGSYYFLVRVGGSRGLKLASHAYEMRKLDGARDELTGTASAMAILHEAVGSANGVLHDLDDYVASRS